MPGTGNLPRKALPITSSEFFRALFAIWRPQQGRGSKHQRIGLAVSGGVDSMALARLSRDFRPTSRLEEIEFRPFVVDHKARPGSTEEAHEVVSALKTLGFWKTKILTLKWPGDIDPTTLPNFETLARKLRFQALGDACRHYDIRTLLLAHHEDDQAETVLMRLTKGHRGAGLEGIKPASNIPECRGMHGVYESGALDRLRHILGAPMESVDTCNKHKSPTIQIEGGGVTIHRPLLQFSKDRLIATCLSADTPWFEDHTNENPTVTPRNAIRQLLKSGNLPEAIQKSSLLAVSRRKREEKVGMNSRTERRVLRCKVSLDARSGRLFIRFPKDLLQRSRKSNTPEEYKGRTRQRLITMAALILRRFLEIVSPLENISQLKLQTAVYRVFPEVFESGESGDGPEINSAESFTVAGVDVRKVASKDNVPGQRDKESQYEDHAWVLTRQPYGRFDPIPMISFLPRTHSKRSVSGPWHLWDGRYWIRVYNHTAKLVTVRPFEPADLIPLRSSLPRWVQQNFKDSLSAAAPGKVRWTLPALVTEGKVVALPTLGFGGQSEEQRGLRWQIRYKKVDLGKDEKDPTKWWGGRYSRYLKARGINSET
ncbi:MAG: hypothetical protein M1840_003197 [Geoglossum simile]|nr:MAG: hypothetical protein M1840_003197 [Geoglossum simile]